MRPMDDGRAAAQPHLSGGELHAFLDGQVDALGAGRAEEVRRHLEVCPACRDRLAVEAAVRERASSILQVGLGAPEGSSGSEGSGAPRRSGAPYGSSAPHGGVSFEELEARARVLESRSGAAGASDPSAAPGGGSNARLDAGADAAPGVGSVERRARWGWAAAVVLSLGVGYGVGAWGDAPVARSTAGGGGGAEAAAAGAVVATDAAPAEVTRTGDAGMVDAPGVTDAPGVAAGAADATGPEPSRPAAASPLTADPAAGTTPTGAALARRPIAADGAAAPAPGQAAPGEVTVAAVAPPSSASPESPLVRVPSSVTPPPTELASEIALRSDELDPAAQRVDSAELVVAPPLGDQPDEAVASADQRAERLLDRLDSLATPPATTPSSPAADLRGLTGELRERAVAQRSESSSIAPPGFRRGAAPTAPRLPSGEVRQRGAGSGDVSGERSLVIEGLRIEELRWTEVWPGQAGLLSRQRLPDGRLVELRVAGPAVGGTEPVEPPPGAPTGAPDGDDETWARALAPFNGGWAALDGPLSAEALARLLATIR